MAAAIGGEDVTTQERILVEDPSTGENFASVPECGPAEVDAAVAAARDTQMSWRLVPVAVRARILRRMAALVERDAESLSNLESRQTGKPLPQGRRDVEITARYFDFYASAIEVFHGDTIPLDSDTLIFTQWEPHGVTAHVIPWNYPLQIMARSIAPALGMGNCCVLKPAEEAPLTALRLAELALEAGLPPGALNVVTGRGPTTGAFLTNHRGIDHISFTGSVETGRLIGRAAAEHTIPVTLELGGKSPNIVFHDADLDRAVPVLVAAILQNCGQTCSAGSRLLVDERIHEEVVARVSERFRAAEVGPALDGYAVGPLINEVQRDRVIRYINERQSTTRVATGGHALTGGRFGAGYFVEPTVVDNVDPESALGREEVFGPVLAVTPFAGIDYAIALANGTDYGLVAGVWTTSLSTAQRMIRDVTAGQIFVNTFGASGGVELPFGGFKRSGHGREKGVEGLRGFARVKTAVVAM